MARSATPRRYPRMARVNEVVREALADALERLSDPRLGLVTITGVDVSPDLRHATVYYSALDPGAGAREVDVTQGGAEGASDDTDEVAARRELTAAALRSATPHLRADLGRGVRMKYVPELTFREDPAIVQGARIEAIIRDLHRHDAPTATEPG